MVEKSWFEKHRVTVFTVVAVLLLLGTLAARLFFLPWGGSPLAQNKPQLFVGVVLCVLLMSLLFIAMTKLNSES